MKINHCMLKEKGRKKKVDLVKLERLNTFFTCLQRHCFDNNNQVVNSLLKKKKNKPCSSRISNLKC